MLTKKQIDTLPLGFFPNSYLRFKFGRGHGHVVPARQTAKDGAEIDTEFVGNRHQYKYRIKHPFKRLPDIEKPVYQSNTIEEKRKLKELNRFMEWIREIVAKLKGLI